LLKLKATNSRINTNDPVCPICMESYTKLNESKIRLMSTYCGHIICKPCMEDLLKNKNEKVFCPVCRNLVNRKKCHDIFLWIFL